MEVFERPDPSTAAASQRAPILVAEVWWSTKSAASLMTARNPRYFCPINTAVVWNNSFSRAYRRAR
jgi:hypothetical protein